MARLVELEDRMEGARTTRTEPYSVARHVAVLTALIAEAQVNEARTRIESKAA